MYYIREQVNLIASAKAREYIAVSENENTRVCVCVCVRIDIMGLLGHRDKNRLNVENWYGTRYIYIRYTILAPSGRG